MFNLTPHEQKYPECDVEEMRSCHKRSIFRDENAILRYELQRSRDNFTPAPRGTINATQDIVVGVVIHRPKDDGEEIGYGHVLVCFVHPKIAELVSLGKARGPKNGG